MDRNRLPHSICLMLVTKATLRDGNGKVEPALVIQYLDLVASADCGRPGPRERYSVIWFLFALPKFGHKCCNPDRPNPTSARESYFSATCAITRKSSTHVVICDILCGHGVSTQYILSIHPLKLTGSRSQVSRNTKAMPSECRCDRI